MTLLHTIYPDGRVESNNYNGPLLYSCPPDDYMKRIIAGPIERIEHVNVLWQDRRCHMFVDEMGKVREPPLVQNRKATRVYWNATWRRLAVGVLVYADLEKPDTIDQDTWADLPLNVRSMMYTDMPHIYGTALLWEGGYD